MSVTTQIPPTVSQPRYANAQEWHDSLGDVPLARIIFNPLPGTATEQDLLALVDGDNKRLCELIDGTLVEKTVGFEESLIALAIASALRAFVQSRKLGIVVGPDAALRMSVGNIRLPDVSFISANDLPGGKRPKDKVPRLPPTLAVEVISEGNTPAEMRQKKREYFASGSKLVWLIYPKTKSIKVFDGPTEKPAQILTGDDVLDGGNVLPGFSMPLSEVFHISDFE
jgi:Uma2 family endonuclease